MACDMRAMATPAASCLATPAAAIGSHHAPSTSSAATPANSWFVRRNANGGVQLGAAGSRWRGSWSLGAVNKTSSSAGSSGEGEKVPEWAKPGSEVLPPWAGGEKAAAVSEEGQDLPFFVYLLASAIVAIASVGSVFEYFNSNPIFGVVQPDSPLWAPILGFFAITGLPVAGFLWYKATSIANKVSEAQDREDGYEDR